MTRFHLGWPGSRVADRSLTARGPVQSHDLPVGGRYRRCRWPAQAGVEPRVRRQSPTAPSSAAVDVGLRHGKVLAVPEQVWERSLDTSARPLIAYRIQALEPAQVSEPAGSRPGDTRGLHTWRRGMSAACDERSGAAAVGFDRAVGSGRRCVARGLPTSGKVAVDGGRTGRRLPERSPWTAATSRRVDPRRNTPRHRGAGDPVHWRESGHGMS